jgi:hypothetical protein
MPVYDMYIRADGWHAIEATGKNAHLSAHIRASEATRLASRNQIEVGNYLYGEMQKKLGTFPQEVITTDRMPVTNDYDYTSHSGITAGMISHIYDLVMDMPPYLSPSTGQVITALCVTAENVYYLREWAWVLTTTGQRLPMPPPAYLMTRHIFGQDTEPGYIWLIMDGPVAQGKGANHHNLHSLWIPDSHRAYFARVKVELQKDGEELDDEE